MGLILGRQMLVLIAVLCVETSRSLTLPETGRRIIYFVTTGGTARSTQVSSDVSTTESDVLTQLLDCAKVTARDPTALQRAEDLWEDLDEPIDTKFYNALLETIAYSRQPDSVIKAQEVFQNMLKRQVAISEETLGLVMEAYTQTKDWDGVDAFWTSSILSGDLDISTNLLNKRLRSLGVQGKAAEAEALMRQYLETLPETVNAKSWVHVLRCYANVLRRLDDPDEKERIFSLMQSLLREMTKHDLTPTTDAYNALLMAIVHHENLPDKALKAESILFGLLDKFNEDPTNEDVRPNADTFFYVFQACRGTDYPKVDTLWQLQYGLWRKASDPEAKRRLIPSTRNLNAALATLSRSRIPNKAHKASQLVQQLESIRVECETAEDAVLLPPLKSDVGTYKNLLRACAFTSHAKSTPRDRKEALEVALATRQTLLNEQRIGGKDATFAYRLLLQTTGHLIDQPSRRDSLATELFQECCDKGLVDESVVTAFERAASETVTLKLLGGFAEDLIKLPTEWTANVDS